MKYIAIAVIAAIVAAYVAHNRSTSAPRRHRHYCDTCRYSRWNRGECRCVKHGYIGKGGNVKYRSGCPDWLSRR